MRAWIAVASAEHVARGRAGGFMQICHGKAAPLRRLGPGDAIVYYSPTQTFRGADRLQAFTAIGHVKPGAVYRAEMGAFQPYRRDVDLFDAGAVAIGALAGRLAFTAPGSNWGYQLRRGLVEIGLDDMAAIRDAMLGATDFTPMRATG